MPSKVDPLPLSSLPIGLLAPLITPAVMERVKERLDLNDEKLALMLVRLINPDEVMSKAEECVLRGVSDKTLKSMKDHDELPQTLCG